MNVKRLVSALVAGAFAGSCMLFAPVTDGPKACGLAVKAAQAAITKGAGSGGSSKSSSSSSKSSSSSSSSKSSSSSSSSPSSKYTTSDGRLTYTRNSDGSVTKHDNQTGRTVTIPAGDSRMRYVPKEVTGSGNSSSSGSSGSGGWSNTNSSHKNNANPFGSDYYRVSQQNLTIKMPDGKTVTVRADTFANDPQGKNGKMALNVKDAPPEVRRALEAAGIKPDSNGYYNINGARSNANVKVDWTHVDKGKYYLGPGVHPDAINYDVGGALDIGNTWLRGGGFATLEILKSNSPVPSGGSSHGGGGGGGGGYNPPAPPTPVSATYRGTVTVAKSPNYVFTMWHRKDDGSLPKMDCTVTWQNIRKEITMSDGSTVSVPVKVTNVTAYHAIHRYANKGWVNVLPAERQSLNLGASGQVADVWRYEKAGQPDSTVHYLLKLEDGNVLDVNFAVPVNGFVTSILANSSDQSRYPLVFDRSAKDHETFDFTVPADGSSSQGAGSPGNASAPSGSTPPPSQPPAPQSLQKPNQGLNYVPGQLLVSLKAGQIKDMLAHLVPGAQITQSLSGLCTITLPPGTDIEAVRTMLNQAGYSANYNYIYSTNPVGSSPASRIKTGYSRLIA